MIHAHWERTDGPPGYFREEDRLGGISWLLTAGAAALLGTLAAGLWRLRRVALAPPLTVAVASGQVFSGAPAPLSSITLEDFDRQFSDTVETLFSRTEKGLPPALRDFCAAEVITAVEKSYRDSAQKFPAGFVQTLALLESKPLPSRPGVCHALYRGLLSSRSVAAAQISAIYLDCTFAMAGAAPLNASGWKLVRVAQCSREDFYRDEEEKARRTTLGLSP